MEPEQELVDPETGEILRQLSEVYDDENELTMFVITPIHSLSDVLRFVLANSDYDVNHFMALAEDVVGQYERLKNID